MNSLNTSEVSIEDTFRILVATDIHLGYAENDPERSNDSFNSFEEILQLAKNHEVDFILLGGDLFHENKPSTQCLHRCMALLRKYCMGEEPVKVEFLSDQETNFKHCVKPVVNYEDPNLNISIPVFSIHGNHDDPSGHVQLSAMDILSVSGLVNYFGKWTDLIEVKVLPILLRKGKSKLAIYGLSHIKDERLSRLFRDGKVHMYRPSEHTNDWFNIFVCHQNRADRGMTKYLPEEALPNFLDLVIWGHEHECRLKEEWSPIQEFHVTQPGSSVATSLCEGEAKEKFVGLLHIVDKKFKLVPLKLKTVRPFVFETITLSDCEIREVDHNVATNVERYLTERIDLLIASAQEQLTGHPQQPVLPLLRVRVEYNVEDQCFNRIRFGQQFQSKVANPADMILLKKEKPKEKRSRKCDDDRDNMEDFLQNEEIDDVWDIKMNMIIEKYFQEVPTAKHLQVLSIKGISDAAARFIDRGDRDSIEQIFNHQRNKVQKHLLDENVELENLDAAIEQFRLNRAQNPSVEADENKKVFNDNIYAIPKVSTSNVQNRIIDSDQENSDDNFGNDVPPPATQRGRGRASRGRAAAAKAPSSRARAPSSRARGSRARGTSSMSSTVTTTITVDNTPKRSTRASTSATTSQNTKLNRLKYDDSDSD